MALGFGKVWAYKVLLPGRGDMMGGYWGVTGPHLQTGGGAGCTLVPLQQQGRLLHRHGSWSGVCMVREGNTRQVFVGFASKTLVKYFLALAPIAGTVGADNC